MPKKWLHLANQKCRVFMHFRKTLKAKYDAEINLTERVLGPWKLEERDRVIQRYRVVERLYKHHFGLQRDGFGMFRITS